MLRKPSPPHCPAARLAIISCCLAGMIAAGRLSAQGNETSLDRAQAEPALAFANEVFDFGRVPPGQKIRHTFILTNPGAALLQILEIKPGCGCTQINSWDRKIPAGGRGAISVELNSAGLLGFVSKDIKVRTNLKSESEKTLWLQGRVEGDLLVTPAAAVFGRLEPGHGWKKKIITITNLRRRPMRLQMTQKYAANFQVRLQEIKTGFKYQLEVAPVLNLITGPHAGGIMLQALLPEPMPLWVPVCAYVSQAWDVRPRKILLPATPGAQAWHKTIYVHPVQNTRYKLTGVTANIENLNPQIQKSWWRREYRVQLVIPANFSMANRKDGHVSLHTDDPDWPLIEIPILVDGAGKGGTR